MKMGRIAVIVMQQRLRQIANSPIHHGHLMHRTLVAHTPVPKQAQLIIREPARPLCEFAKNIIVSRNIPARLRPFPRHAANFRGKRGRAPLIRIHEEDPIRLHGIQSGVPLRGIVGEGVLPHIRARRPRQRGCVILAVGIEHEDAIRPTEAVDAGDNMLGFIERENDGGQRHVWLLIFSRRFCGGRRARWRRIRCMPGADAGRRRGAPCGSGHAGPTGWRAIRWVCCDASGTVGHGCARD